MPRFSNLTAFEEHVKAQKFSGPGYLILTADDAERRAIFHKLIPHSFSLFSLEQEEFSSLMQTLSPSLFDEEFFVYDAVDALKKKELSLFLEEVKRKRPFVLGARSKSGLTSLEKEIVILDLLDEKVWEKRARFIEMFKKRVLSEGKQIEESALHLFLDRIGLEFSFLEKEMDKILSFTLDKTHIVKEDIEKIASGYSQETLWQISEKIIWEREKLFFVESPSFSAYSPLFRYHLLMGKKIASLLQYRVEDWGSFLPKMWPKMREKRKSQVQMLGPLYFEKGLDLLFSLDLLSRSSSQNESTLFDRFRLELSSYVR